MVIARNQGWKNEAVHWLLREPTIAAHVDVLGRVSNERLALLYRDADFVVAPSLYEGFGLVVLEAIAAGMRRLIEDRDLHRELSRRGLNRSKLFSWDRASDKTLEVLEEVAKQA